MPRKKKSDAEKIADFRQGRRKTHPFPKRRTLRDKYLEYKKGIRKTNPLSKKKLKKAVSKEIKSVLITETLSDFGRRVWENIEYGIRAGATDSSIFKEIGKINLGYMRNEFLKDIRSYRLKRKMFPKIEFVKEKNLIEEMYYRPISPKQDDAILTQKKFLTKFRIIEKDETTGIEEKPKFFTVSHDVPQTRSELELSVYVWATQYRKIIVSIIPIAGMYNPDF